MKRVSVAALKAHLSRYLDTVKAGEEVVVTDRGRPVARLTSIGNEPGSANDNLERLVRAGLVRPAIAKLPKEFWDHPRPQDPDGRVLAALLEERAESR